MDDFSNSKMSPMAVLAEIQAFCAQRGLGADLELFLVKCVLLCDKRTYRPLLAKTSQTVHVVSSEHSALIAVDAVPDGLLDVVSIVDGSFVVDVCTVAPRWVAAKKEFARLRSRAAIAERKSMRAARDAYMAQELGHLGARK